jgi:hypothetical protein
VIEEEGKIEGLYLEDHTFSRTFLPVRFVLQFGRNSFVLAMLEANQDAYDYDLHGLTEYLDSRRRHQLVLSTIRQRMTRRLKPLTSHAKENGNGNGELRSFKRNGDSNNNQPFKKPERTQCTISKKFHKGECFFKNKPDTESNTKTNGSKFTVKQYANLMKSMMANATAFTPSKKKRTIAESEDDKEKTFKSTTKTMTDTALTTKKCGLPCAKYLAKCRPVRKRTIDIRQ